MKFDEYDTICPIEIHAAGHTSNPSSDLHNRASLYFDMIFKLDTIGMLTVRMLTVTVFCCYLLIGVRLILKYGMSSLEVCRDQKAKYSIVSRPLIC